MEENQRPFVCSVEGCMLRFTLEDHLTAHKRKHDMVLNLENGQKTNIFMADQTPTPTRFIRNCEEVGLFQDLQNVNPFEETFRKAVEATRVGGSHIEVTSLHTTTDDTLHTPHVFPNIVEEHPTVSDLISSTPAERGRQEKSPTRIDREELERLEVSHILYSNSPTVEVNNETRTDLDTIEMTNLRSAEEEVNNQEADASQKVPHPASSSGSSGGKIPVANVSVNDSVQVVIRMPNGQLVQLSGVSMGSVPSTQLPIQITPSVVSRTSVSQSAVVSNVQFVQNAPQRFQGSSQSQPNVVNVSSSGISVTSAATSSQSRLSAAKMKLKQRIQCNYKQKALPPEPGTSSTILCEVPLLRTHRAPSSDGSDSCASHGKKLANGQDDADEQRMRFRERNRAAAMRCREKRKHWILELEKRAEETQRTNKLLSTEVAKLRNELIHLKTLFLAHKDCSVSKAMEQGTRIVIERNRWSEKINPDVQHLLEAAHSTPPDFEEVEVNACSSPEEQSQKIVLLSKPSGLKRRRQAAAALTVGGSAGINTETDQHSHSVSESLITSAHPIAKISRNHPQQEAHKVVVGNTISTSKPCVIAVATPAIVSRVPIRHSSSLKKPSVASTPYFVPPKVHPLLSETSHQVSKINSSVLKSDGTDTSKTNIVNHASGDCSMDSGHGSDIEILMEIPTKNENRS